MNYVGSGCKPWDSLGCKSTWETNSNSGWSSSNTHDTRLQQVAALRGIVHQLLAGQKSSLPFVASLLAMHPRVLRKTLLSHYYYLLLITTCRRGRKKAQGSTNIKKHSTARFEHCNMLQYVAIMMDHVHSCFAQDWCCDSWCYVNNSCPIAKQSWLGTGFYFSYETCSLDQTSVSQCKEHTDG